MSLSPVCTTTVLSCKCCARAFGARQTRVDGCTCVTVQCLSAPCAMTFYLSSMCGTPPFPYPPFYMQTLRFLSSVQLELPKPWKQSRFPWNTQAISLSEHFQSCAALSMARTFSFFSEGRFSWTSQSLVMITKDSTAGPPRHPVRDRKGSTKTPTVRSPKRTPKPKNRANSTKEISEQFEGVAGHYPLKQGFRGQSHQKVHPKVRRHLCRKRSLGFLCCP